MVNVFGDTQQTLLKLLLEKKAGLSIDELTKQLGITRTAVRQHVTALEKLGFVEPGKRVQTGGRPLQNYKLTRAGNDIFPKQYSWFSELLLDSLRDEKGSAAMKRWLTKLGEAVGESFEPKLAEMNLDERVGDTVDLMNSLGYQATRATKTGQSRSNTIEASNCVYHALAEKFPEICELDLALLAKLSGGTVKHTDCMMKGGSVCRFKIQKRNSG